MSAQRDDGGPAYPRNYDADGHNGMSLRDAFAMAALTGFCSDKAFTLDIDGRVLGIKRAEAAYLLADAMLEARKA
jgi:hypothetical protein